MTAASAFDKSLPECSIPNAPGKSSFLSFIRVAWGGLPPAYSLFSRLPGRGGMTDPCNCLFSHFPGARAIYSILTKQDRFPPLQHKSRWNHLIPAAYVVRAIGDSNPGPPLPESGALPLR